MLVTRLYSANFLFTSFTIPSGDAALTVSPKHRLTAEKPLDRLPLAGIVFLLPVLVTELLKFLGGFALGDIFRLGMDVASEEPMFFIKNKILEKYPVLKEDVKEEEIKGDFEKIYG